MRVSLETDEQDEDDDTPKEEYLITNLSKEIAPYEDFKELNHQRWSVETEFDRLKKYT